MEISDKEFAAANRRAAERRTSGAFAVSARVTGKDLIVSFATGAQIRVPLKLIEGLRDAPAAALKTVEISPAGLGVRFSTIDVDVYVPALMKGVFGSAGWMKALSGELAALGGRQRSTAKGAAARENGKRGGRPRLTVAG